MTITTTPILTMYDQLRATERALVAVGQPVVGLGVVLSDGVFITSARTALTAAIGDDSSRLAVLVGAADDWRWRGAMAGVLAVEKSLAVIGRAEWLDVDAREALDHLLRERLSVDVAVLHAERETVIVVPMPNGSWLRFPAVPYGKRILVVRAEPLADCDVVFELLDDAPAFTEPGQLAGFVHVLRSPHTRQVIAVVVRVDAVIGSGWLPTEDSQPFTRPASAA